MQQTYMCIVVFFFNMKQEYWSSYVEESEHFVIANDTKMQRTISGKLSQRQQVENNSLPGGSWRNRNIQDFECEHFEYFFSQTTGEGQNIFVNKRNQRGGNAIMQYWIIHEENVRKLESLVLYWMRLWKTEVQWVDLIKNLLTAISIKFNPTSLPALWMHKRNGKPIKHEIRLYERELRRLQLSLKWSCFLNLQEKKLWRKKI